MYVSRLCQVGIRSYLDIRVDKWAYEWIKPTFTAFNSYLSQIVEYIHSICQLSASTNRQASDSFISASKCRGVQ